MFKAPAVIFGIFFLLMAYFLIWLYKWLLKKLKEADFTREWLSGLELLVSALLFAVPNLCFDLGSYVVLSLIPPVVYQNWRLYRRSKPYWRHWYFVTARDYFRMLKDQNPDQFRLHSPGKRTGAGLAKARRS
jgi:hypothetical protein